MVVIEFLMAIVAYGHRSGMGRAYYDLYARIAGIRDKSDALWCDSKVYTNLSNEDLGMVVRALVFANKISNRYMDELEAYPGMITPVHSFTNLTNEELGKRFRELFPTSADVHIMFREAPRGAE